MLEENGRAKGLQVTFTGEPHTYAPDIQEVADGPVKAHITGRNDRLMLVKHHVEQAAAFLECLYNVDLATDEIEAKYEGETPEEEKLIAVKGMKVGKAEHPLPLTFDMLTRSFMAAEAMEGPKFQATLVKAARNSLFCKQFIDSFRYSFLLIESLYGDGKFKTAAQNTALNSNASFVDIVKRALVSVMPPKSNERSYTSDLLATNPSPKDVIAHLVDKRGFYFHGNLKRHDAWKPNEQGSAEHLALLAVGIAQEITMEATSPIFDPLFGSRHYNDAMNAGAKIVFEINFSYREPEEQFVREGKLLINTPGTKVTGKQANAVAQQFLQHFEHNTPVAALRSASCKVQNGGQKVFDMAFHVN